VKYTARYRRKGINPFGPPYHCGTEGRNDACSITADFPKKTPIEKIVAMAKSEEAVPKGFEFIEVISLRGETE